MYIFGISCRNSSCQHKHNVESDKENMTKNDAEKEAIDKDTDKEFVDNNEKDTLESALSKVKSIEDNKKEMETKFKLYSGTIRKMMKDKKVEIQNTPGTAGGPGGRD